MVCFVVNSFKTAAHLSAMKLVLLNSVNSHIAELTASHASSTVAPPSLLRANMTSVMAENKVMKSVSQ
jgi:hypothetical protein